MSQQRLEADSAVSVLSAKYIPKPKSVDDEGCSFLVNNFYSAENAGEAEWEFAVTLGG
jgi:hypothetical protein